MNILVTGGAGYIGSHTVLELLQQDHEVVVIDNLSNSSSESLKRVEKITNKKIRFIESDVQNEVTLNQIFSDHKLDAVIHFAGLKSVGESVSNPLLYYRNNLESTLILCDVMKKFGVKKLVFSSSATVYGTPKELPIHETSQTGVGITNPYGQTKYIIEKILKDIANSDRSLSITLLRYFNPIGAHESGLIGENPSGIPNNLLPYISQVAVGKLNKLKVFGNDYDTPDGTGIRDYIHVVDLANGHIAALMKTKPGTHAYNLGTGKGTSVLELISAFETASGKFIPYEIMERREGDVASCYASPIKAADELGWRATRSIQEACEDSWRWQSHNPGGY
ncbi:MAG TPA: UDP-glucose 4-epimerase GalE [Candidatus Saccharibacteria bacterium]|mgnify:CR=1 FL=1|jgi:UDP-glucose 4-epimerase|nr:UDP-glucose 4-epimerase GalE [Candidatus Saccharibacteria bacterium]